MTRPRSPAMDALLGVQHKVLDHGLVRAVDYMGDDAAIVQAARVSYGAGTKTLNEDRGLIRYLVRHRHTTPLEMCEIKLHLKMPIFVARQWIRHRTANVNEGSARYSILAREFYIPQLEDILPQSKTNKQGGAGELEDHIQELAWATFATEGERAFEAYDRLLLCDVARETARIGLPLSTYTEMYWKVDLHNLLHFLTLRTDSHAQMEIRAFADVIAEIVSAWTPHAYEAWLDYQKHSLTLSRQAVLLVQQLLAGKNPSAEALGMTKREFDEVLAALEEQPHA